MTRTSMERRISSAILSLIGAVALGTLAAEPAQPPADSPATRNPPADSAAKEEPTPLFEQLDVNNDGFITMTEAKRSAIVTARFKELDIDRDGKISKAEFKKGMQPKL